MSLAGGPAVTLFDGPVFGASWELDDTVVFGHTGNGLWQVSSDGGDAEQLVLAEDGDYRWPHVLPGGRAVLYTIWRGSLDTSEVAVLSLESGETRTLVGGSSPRYASTGHLLFGRQRSLWAVPFDLARLEIVGSPAPVLEDIQVDPGFGGSAFAFGPNGSLIYFPDGGRDSAATRLVWVPREGGPEVGVATAAHIFTNPKLSPDGTRVLLDARDGEDDLWVWDFTRETLTRLTFSTESDRFGVWTADGQRVVFTSGRDGTVNSALYWRAADGTGTAERLTESSSRAIPNAVSPDGKRLVFVGGGNRDLHVLTLDDERRVEPLIATEFYEGSAAISPDGRWLAYEADASGQIEVYVQPFPNVDDGLWQISATGGRMPSWGPDGRKLFYLTGAGVMGVTVDTDAGFEAGRPDLVVDGAVLFFDVAPDGRFLTVKMSPQIGDAGPARQIHVVQDWTQELLERVPVP